MPFNHLSPSMAMSTHMKSQSLSQVQVHREADARSHRGEGDHIEGRGMTLSQIYPQICCPLSPLKK